MYKLYKVSRAYRVYKFYTVYTAYKVYIVHTDYRVYPCELFEGSEICTRCLAHIGYKIKSSLASTPPQHSMSLPSYVRQDEYLSDEGRQDLLDLLLSDIPQQNPEPENPQTPKCNRRRRYRDFSPNIRKSKKPR